MVDPPKKERRVIFFQVIQLLFKCFMTDVSEGFIRKQFAFPGKTVHRKQLLPSEHFYLLLQASTSHKNFKKIVKALNVHKLALLQKDFFSFNLLLMKF